MSLKREIAELEQVEEMQEEEELTEEMRQAEQRSIGEKVVGLYRRISIIVEYIDNQEATTIKEQQLREAEYREKAWELQAIELDLKNKDLTKLLKEKETEKNISGDNAFQEGVSYAMKVADGMIQKALSITVPSSDSIRGLTELLSQSVRSGKKEKEQSEESGKSQGTDRPKGEKSRVVGLGRTVGDV